jgi:hypothetical protein
MRRIIFFGLVAAALWLPNMHRFCHPDREQIAKAIAERTLAPDDTDILRMRAVNPEWDFMSRTFTVLGLSTRAVEHPQERERVLVAIDRMLGDALARPQEDFLLPYARRAPFVDPEGSSLFIDGEILMMIGARNRVEHRSDLDAEAKLRADRIERVMRRSPTLSGESYPDECWTFCNTTALAALAMFGRGRDLAKDWIAYAKVHLVDPKTGILVSSYTRDGKVKDGAEGSSIWMSATNLLAIDDGFARDQYARARKELGRTFLGFGYAREWPSSEDARPDVDSGPIVPLFDASAGSSGLAILGASAFGDDEFRDALLASLELAAFPKDGDRGREYLASNAVGDAVLLHALEYR